MKRAVLVCTVTIWAEQRLYEHLLQRGDDGSGATAADVREVFAGSEPDEAPDVFVVGRVENEGDIEKLLTDHLDRYGDYHRPFVTLVVEGTPLWEAVFSDEPGVGDHVPIGRSTYRDLLLGPNPALLSRHFNQPDGAT